MDDFHPSINFDKNLYDKTLHELFESKVKDFADLIAIDSPGKNYFFFFNFKFINYFEI